MEGSEIGTDRAAAAAVAVGLVVDRSFGVASDSFCTCTDDGLDCLSLADRTFSPTHRDSAQMLSYDDGKKNFWLALVYWRETSMSRLGGNNFDGTREDVVNLFEWIFW